MDYFSVFISIGFVVSGYFNFYLLLKVRNLEESYKHLETSWDATREDLCETRNTLHNERLLFNKIQELTKYRGM